MKEQAAKEQLLKDQAALEDTRENSKEVKKEGIEEEKLKRSYSLKETTIKKLEEMKVFLYPRGTALEDIVDEAICLLYKSKKGE